MQIKEGSKEREIDAERADAKGRGEKWETHSVSPTRRKNRVTTADTDHLLRPLLHFPLLWNALLLGFSNSIEHAEEKSNQAVDE